MKRDKQYNEEEIQNLLKQMPAVQDRQTAEQLYNSISSQLTHEPKPPPFYKRTWFPAAAAAFAILMVVVISMAFMFNQGSRMADENKITENNESSSNAGDSQSSEDSGESAPQSNSTSEESAEGNESSQQKDNKTEDSNEENYSTGETSQSGGDQGQAESSQNSASTEGQQESSDSSAENRKSDSKQEKTNQENQSDDNQMTAQKDDSSENNKTNENDASSAETNKDNAPSTSDEKESPQSQEKPTSNHTEAESGDAEQENKPSPENEGDTEGAKPSPDEFEDGPNVATSENESNNHTFQGITGPSSTKINNVATINEKEHFATVGLPINSGKGIIPVSFIAPKKWGSLEAIYNQVGHSIHSKQWGLGPYLFNDVTFTFHKDKKTITAAFPKGYETPKNALEEQNIIQSLKVMFRDHSFQTIQLKHGGERGLSFKHAGEISSINIDSNPKRTYTIFRGDQQFLKPLYLEESTTISEAIRRMQKANDGKGFSSKMIEFTSITSKGNRLELYLSSGQLIDGANETMMIEAILMTAKSYGFESVFFKGAGISSVGDYSLTEPIQVPTVVNPKKFLLPNRENTQNK
ncbi:hypothetical protein GLW05_03740 [Pontibacillus yanchengensis]|uniref:GerMN domain-containing protein n=1 Tax=Pontibacillus yanchengensis TaxID=462910 RepID=A0A6I4ZY69_9BACI|nr:hypothetical protein [Pontibacillus yanchengensis]MYL32703.1 hypothetical protein [Pontibacillus yanchengensis]